MASNLVVKLNLINNSNDVNDSEVVIFQQNVAPGYSELAVAWTVIQNLGAGDHHPFDFPLELEVDANDAWGNYTPQFTVYPGDAYSMQKTTSGDQLLPYPAGSASPTDIDVRNDLVVGSMGANIYRDGKLLATKTNVAPNQKATFVFKPSIFIGVASEIEEGEIMDSAILSSINTQLSLLGIKAADIVMTGGGGGPKATAFQFSLQNVQYA